MTWFLPKKTISFPWKERGKNCLPEMRRVGSRKQPQWITLLLGHDDSYFFYGEKLFIRVGSHENRFFSPSWHKLSTISIVLLNYYYILYPFPWKNIRWAWARNTISSTFVSSMCDPSQASVAAVVATATPSSWAWSHDRAKKGSHAEPPPPPPMENATTLFVVSKIWPPTVWW